MENVQTTSDTYLQYRLLLFPLLFIVLFIIFCFNITLGSVDISLSTLLTILTSGAMDTPDGFIIWKLRIPRAVGAVLGGGFLAVSGLLLQVYFRNPIVGPYILGISSGATLMVALVMLTTLHLGFMHVSPYLTTLAALVGAYSIMFVVLGIASRIRSAITLLVTGLMVGYVCTAVTNVLLAFAEKERIKGFVLWGMGSFAGFRWSEVGILVVLGGSLVLLVFLLTKPLNAFLLGEEYASTMGVNIRVFRLLILLCSCSLAGIVTAFAGPVAFIGLAVPHMARLCFGTSDNRLLVPGAMILGGAITSLCDLLARLVFSPVELPLSALTAFFGAPIVVGLLFKKGASL